MERWISVGGLFTMLAIAWLFSEDKRRIPWRAIITGLLLQFGLALFILRTDIGLFIFEGAREAIQAVVALSDQGAKFVFGDAFKDHFFAFSVLPTIIFVSSLSYVFFHFGVMQKIVEWMAKIMVKTMGASGSESLCAAANVFMGQTEAPMLIRPYLQTMTRSEILCMMCGGMASVAGGVLAAYVAFGIPAGHLLAASLMSAPACIMISKLMLPEKEVSPTMGQVNLKVDSEAANAIDAACIGASEGLKLALNVAAMLIAFIALVALINLVIRHVGTGLGFPGLSIEYFLSFLFRPIAWVMGVPWSESGLIGQLLGEKVTINEFYAYIHMGEFMKAGQLSPRSINIATYALCGFANFSSIAIQIGGIGAMAPDRRKDFAELGFRSFVAGNLASFMTACIAGILL